MGMEAALSNFLEMMTGEDAQLALANDDVRNGMAASLTKLFNDETFVLNLLKLDDDLTAIEGTDCRVKVTHKILSDDTFVGGLLGLVAGYGEEERNAGEKSPLEEFYEIITTENPIETCDTGTLETIVNSLDQEGMTGMTQFGGNMIPS